MICGVFIQQVTFNTAECSPAFRNREQLCFFRGRGAVQYLSVTLLYSPFIEARQMDKWRDRQIDNRVKLM